MLAAPEPPQTGTGRLSDSHRSPLFRSPADPTFTLRIAFGVAPEEILHIRHCRTPPRLPQLGAAPRWSLRHETNETRQCRKDLPKGLLSFCDLFSRPVRRQAPPFRQYVLIGGDSCSGRGEWVMVGAVGGRASPGLNLPVGRA